MTETRFSAFDHHCMARALRLAERGAYTTRPNPMVGCVITQGEETVGEGWHQKAGEPHAEVFALQAAGERARGATAYVTLEPCIMCAGACIQARITGIIYGAPDPKAGALHSCYRIGTDGLLNHTLTVQGGLLAEDCSAVLINFFKERRKRQSQEKTVLWKKSA